MRILLIFLFLFPLRARGGGTSGRSGYDTPPSRSGRHREGSIESGLEADAANTGEES